MCYTAEGALAVKVTVKPNEISFTGAERSPRIDAADWARAADFGVFHSALDAGGRVMGLCVKGGASLSRKEITALEELVKTYLAGD